MMSPSLSSLRPPLSLFLLIVASACASDPNRYRQPNLPQDQVARLRMHYFGGRVARVDDRPPPEIGIFKTVPEFAELEPGPHSADIEFGGNGDSPPILSWREKFDAKNGVTYQFASASIDNLLRVWFEEAETGKILGMRSVIFGNRPAEVRGVQQPVTPSIAGGRDHRVIAVRAQPYDDEADWQEPVRGAGHGAASGAAIWSKICFSQVRTETQFAAGFSVGAPSMGGAGGGGDGAARILCLVFTPFAAVVGAIVSHSDEEVTAATAALKNALLAAKSNERIEGALTEQLRAVRSGRYEVRPLSGREAGFSDDDLARQGIDAVLAFQVSPLDLLVSGNEINPDAALRLSVQAKIVDTNSGAATPNWSWEYRGSSFDYFDLAAEDARLLRLSIDECYPEIARLMVSDLFVESGASSSGGEALRQSGEAPLQTGRLETPPSDAAKPTLDEVKRIVRRIDATVERDSIEFLKAQQVVPEDSIRIGLVSWDIIAVTRDSFTLEVFLRFRTGASETFKLRGRIDDEKVIYTEVLAPESESVR